MKSLLLKLQPKFNPEEILPDGTELEVGWVVSFGTASYLYIIVKIINNNVICIETNRPVNFEAVSWTQKISSYHTVYRSEVYDVSIYQEYADRFIAENNWVTS